MQWVFDIVNGCIVFRQVLFVVDGRRPAIGKMGELCLEVLASAGVYVSHFFLPYLTFLVHT